LREEIHIFRRPFSSFYVPLQVSWQEFENENLVERFIQDLAKNAISSSDQQILIKQTLTINGIKRWLHSGG
jgi:hypothetical protein